jgi:glycosyltransferase involved in cell wall biosynthesis
MRIILVDSSLFTPPYDLHLGEGLAALGHDVELFGRRLRKNESALSETVRFSPFFYRLSDPLRDSWAFGRSLKLAELPIDAIRFVRHVRHLRPDVIHFQWLSIPLVDRWIVNRIKAMGIKVVMTVHDTTPLNDAARSVAQLFGWRQVLQQFDTLIVHTETSKRRLLEMGVTVPVSIIPHGLLHFGDPVQKSRDENVILFFGSIKHYKGLDLLLQAFDRMRTPAKLRVVGAPRDPAPYLKILASMQKRDCVELDFRFFDNREIPSLMADASLIVFPYRLIDGSGALLTALAYRKPFLATDVGMFKELAGESSPALVPAENIDALASRMDEALTDLPRFQEISDRIRKSIPSWKEIASLTLEAYGTAGKAPGLKAQSPT